MSYLLWCSFLAVAAIAVAVVPIGVMLRRESHRRWHDGEPTDALRETQRALLGEQGNNPRYLNQH